MNTQLLTAALASFTPEAIANYVSTRRVNLDKYFLARFLPPVVSTDADIRDGNIRIISGVAGITAPDSPYAKVGDARAEEFNGSTIKLTAEATLTERHQRVLISRVNTTILNRGNPTATITSFLANMMEDGVMLSMDNGAEVLRGLALATGEIRGTFGGNVITVDYSVPEANRPAKRTAGSAYGGANSKFWDDVEYARRILMGGEPQFITEPGLANAIINNPANGIVPTSRTVVNDWLTVYTLTQGIRQADGSYDTSRTTMDTRKNVTLWVYAGYAENGPNPEDRVPFWPRGRMTAALPGTQRVDVVDGQVVQGALGVTHVGPTVEAGGASTRFAQMVRPELKSYEVTMQAVENLLPQLRESRRAVFFSSDVPAS